MKTRITTTSVMVADERRACPARAASASRAGGDPCCRRSARRGTRRGSRSRPRSRSRSSRRRRQRGRRSRPTRARRPARRSETTSESRIPNADPEHRRDPEVLEEVDDRIGDGGVAARDDAGEHEREHRAGRVVQRRLGDGRLLDLLPDADARRRAGSGSPDRSARATAPISRPVDTGRRRRALRPCR